MHEPSEHRTSGISRDESSEIARRRQKEETRDEMRWEKEAKRKRKRIRAVVMLFVTGTINSFVIHSFILSESECNKGISRGGEYSFYCCSSVLLIYFSIASFTRVYFNLFIYCLVNFIFMLVNWCKHETSCYQFIWYLLSHPVRVRWRKKEIKWISKCVYINLKMIYTLGTLKADWVAQHFSFSSWAVICFIYVFGERERWRVKDALKLNWKECEKEREEKEDQMHSLEVNI